MKLGFLLIQKPYLMQTVDVGQGDAIFITTPHRYRILIDGGDNYEIDNFISSQIPFFNCKLHLVVLTHPHSDHLKGLNRLLQRCSVSNIIYNPIKYDSLLYYEWLERTKKLTMSNGLQPSHFNVDGIYFKVLWPTSEALLNVVDVNDSSIVLFMDYKNFEAILTGDATKTVLDNICYADFSRRIDSRVDVYKVPHHGSKNALSTKFIKIIDPVYSIISVGKNNKFNHPDSETLNFLSNYNTILLRTDLQKTIKNHVL